MIYTNRVSLLIFCLFTHTEFYAQDPIISTFEVIDGDTIINTKVKELELIVFKDARERREFEILKRKVLKVYPYAILSKYNLDKMNSALDSIPRRRSKRKYIRSFTKKIKNEYKKDLSQLTMSEGKILVKLVYRETSKSSFDIVKSYRGRFNAFIWQTLAKLYDNNLKVRYDPFNVREDQLIEYIILQQAQDN